MYKMITIQANSFDILDIEKELNLKVGGIKELSSKLVLEELANAVFTITATAFKKSMDLQAKGNPKAYHHIYEWNQIGTEKGRLFFLWKEGATAGNLIIKPGFMKSKTKVPIDPILLEPGKTGKRKCRLPPLCRGYPGLCRAGKDLCGIQYIHRSSDP